MKDATRIKTENESDDLDKAFHTFVTENNVQAILNVLRHSEVQQTKSGLTDEIELSARVGCNPVMQKELRDTFLVLNIEALPSEDLIKMINFVDLLKLEKNVKTDPLLHPILRKRCISYMDHMFDHHTPFVKGQLLMTISCELANLTEQFLETQIDIKEQEPEIRSRLMYDYNGQKAVDYLATTTHITEGNSKSLMFLLLVNAHSRSQMHKNLIKYTVDTYDHVLTDEHKEMLRKESKKATSEEGRIYDYHRGQTESASIDFNELITTKDFAALFHRRDNDREDKGGASGQSCLREVIANSEIMIKDFCQLLMEADMRSLLPRTREILCFLGSTHHQSKEHTPAADKLFRPLAAKRAEDLKNHLYDNIEKSGIKTMILGFIVDVDQTLLTEEFIEQQKEIAPSNHVSILFQYNPIKALDFAMKHKVKLGILLTGEVLSAPKETQKLVYEHLMGNYKDTIKGDELKILEYVREKYEGE